MTDTDRRNDTVKPAKQPVKLPTDPPPVPDDELYEAGDIATPEPNRDDEKPAP